MMAMIPSFSIHVSIPNGYEEKSEVSLLITES